MRKTSTILTGALFALLLSASCSGNKERPNTLDTISVKAIKLNADDRSGVEAITYDGTLQADKVIDLSFQVSGTINTFPVNAGDYVKKGRLVASVDETTYRNQYNAQMSQAKLAEENYNRVNAVYQKGSVAEIKMLEAKSNFEQAVSSAKAIYQNLAHTRLFAPESGFIGSKKTEAGAIANPGQPVLQLLDTRTLDVLVAVPENEINRYKAGDNATVTIGALGDSPLTGKVSEIGVLALDNSASYNVKIKLSNTEKTLKPGMLCKVVLKISSRNGTDSSALVVPLQAVQVDEIGRNFVYIITPQQTAKRKEVKTGTLYDNGMAITSGLNGSEQLIISGYQKLADNSPVIVKP